MARPGMMIYFDMLEPMRVLDDAERGRLLVAMLEYGKDGTLPKFDGMLALAWGFVKPKIDKDEEQYQEAISQRNYASFCKQRNSRKFSKIPYEEWVKLSEEERRTLTKNESDSHRPGLPGGSRYPTTTTTTTTDTTTTTSTTTAAATSTTTNVFEDEDEAAEAAAAAAAKKMQVWKDSSGRGAVMLSDEQIGDLLDQMGLEAFDYYVDKLTAFILEKHARVANHYETILKWWRRDSKLEKR